MAEKFSVSVSKAQHGCIDCLALMICAELQALASFKDFSEKFRIVGKAGDSGWYIILIISIMLLAGHI